MPHMDERFTGDLRFLQCDDFFPVRRLALCFVSASRFETFHEWNMWGWRRSCRHRSIWRRRWRWRNEFLKLLQKIVLGALYRLEGGSVKDRQTDAKRQFIEVITRLIDPLLRSFFSVLRITRATDRNLLLKIIFFPLLTIH